MSAAMHFSSLDFELIIPVLLPAFTPAIALVSSLEECYHVECIGIRIYIYIYIYIYVCVCMYVWLVGWLVGKIVRSILEGINHIYVYKIKYIYPHFYTYMFIIHPSIHSHSYIDLLIHPSIHLLIY